MGTPRFTETCQRMEDAGWIKDGSLWIHPETGALHSFERAREMFVKSHGENPTGSNTVYVIVELASDHLRQLRVFGAREAADRSFKDCMAANNAREREGYLWATDGTIRAASSPGYEVQLLEQPLN